MRLVRFEDGRLEIALERSVSRSLIADLQRKLPEWTGKRWMVIVSSEQGESTRHQQAREREIELKRGVRSDPLVQAVLERFPGAEIVGVMAPASQTSTADAVEPPPDDNNEDSDG